MIYTMGHSSWTETQFLAALGSMPDHDRKLVIDVRSHLSSKWPQFRHPKFEMWVRAAGHGYLHLPELGGWTEKHLPLSDQYAKHDVSIQTYAGGFFPKHHIAKQVFNAWHNVGLYDYAWYTTTRDFADGIKLLMMEEAEADVVLVCAEVLWWKCHRSMISDCLYYLGKDSHHILPRFRRDGTCVTKVAAHSTQIGGRIERYAPAIHGAWCKIFK